VFVSTFVNPLRSKGASGYVAGLQRIRQWAVERLSGDPIVSVSEFSCAEAGCPPRETVILIMWPDGRVWKARIHKAIPDVMQDEVLLSLQTAEHIGPKTG
jgi:hypothetical protein